MTADISRLFRDRPKQYRALVHQQGRLPLDSEENHGADIAQWVDEERFVETIAPSGSPNDGFMVALTADVAPVNFTIAAGSYYIGGSRIENPALLNYRDQKNGSWLAFQLDAEGANEAIGAEQKFLVWLDVREAVVTATEDSELLEPGLGGADGAARKRFSWRVRATPVAGPDCLAAADQWLAAAGWTDKVEPETGLLASGAKLTVSFNPADVDQDLCQPSLTPGFLGARNECYRVQVTAPGRYVWGQDDAAPLYRVRVENVAGQPRRIVFLDRPRDEYVRPRAGHTVELLRWDQLLPNGQKTAEAVGRFFSVAGGYVDDAITLSSSVDAGWLSWLSGLPLETLSTADGEQRYFYLRVWTGGGQGGQPDIPAATADLSGTGLSLAFGAGAFPGDYWVIAARPNAPARVLPWELMQGMTAHGPRRHVVPLAFVDLAAKTVSDCRRRFRPLYKVGGCCTVTVGDGVSSWGDVSSIADAVLRLPAAGGEICIGPGTYAETVALTGLRNITFTGCRGRTRWLSDETAPAEPLLDLRGCTGIRVKDLAMECATGQCIRAETIADADGADAPCADLVFEDLALTAPSGSAIAAYRVKGLQLRRCRVAAGPFPDGAPPEATSGMAAVYLQGEDLLIERNIILSSAGENGLPSQRPLGGLHIGGESRRIVVLRNAIEGGNGNGITLGSVRILAIPAAAWSSDREAATQNAVGKSGRSNPFVVGINDAGCINIGWQDPEPTPKPDGTVEVPVSDGLVSEIRIEKNEIGGMGGNGVGTFPMFVILASGEPAEDAVAVERLLILDNTIINCMALEAPKIPPIQYLFTGFGGVALAMALDCTIRDNQISDLSPGRDAPACGIFVGYGEDLRVERNRIENTGTGRNVDVSAVPSGGIFVRLALGGISTFAGGSEDTRSRDRPAILVQNNIVHASYGRALKVLASGPVIVTGNRLTGSNPSLFFANPLGALILLLLVGSSVQKLIADPSEELSVTNLVLLNILIDILGGDSVQIVNMGVAEELLGLVAAQVFRSRSADPAATDFNLQDQPAVNQKRTSPSPGAIYEEARRSGAFRQTPAASALRGGEILFSDNQVSLQPPDEQGQGTISSVFILTRDDLGFADNQVEIEAGVFFAFSDAILIATTLRAEANRCQEAAFCALSLGSFALDLNNTSNNQTTCVLGAFASNSDNVVSEGNQSALLP
jgi:hypothetical protein